MRDTTQLVADAVTAAGFRCFVDRPGPGSPMPLVVLGGVGAAITNARTLSGAMPVEGLVLQVTGVGRDAKDAMWALSGAEAVLDGLHEALGCRLECRPVMGVGPVDSEGLAAFGSRWAIYATEAIP